MCYFNEVFARIRFATNIRTQVQLAKALGIKQSSISDAKKRDSIPADWLIKLHDKYDLSIDWLRQEAGPVYNWERGADETGLPRFPLLVENGSEELPLASGEVVRVFSTTCDYREGQPMPEFQTHGYIQVPSQFYQEKLLVFRVDSGGMEPTLNKGGYAGLMPSPFSLISGEVYAILMPYEGVVFRRIVLDAESGAYLLCFDKKGLPAVRLPADVLRDRVVGKLTWVLHGV